MKKKDIIVIVVCIVVIVGSIVFILKGFSSKPVQTTTKSNTTIEFTGNIDSDTIEKLKTRKDYGAPPMDNIGRENPFASL